MRIWAVICAAIASTLAQAQATHHQRVEIQNEFYSCQVSTPTDKMTLSLAEEFDEMIQIHDQSNRKSYLVASAIDEGEITVEVYESTNWEVKQASPVSRYVFPVTHQSLLILVPKPPHHLKISCPPWAPLSQNTPSLDAR